ncbi:hypothetical protein [Nocardia brasiliensis]
MLVVLVSAESLPQDAVITAAATTNGVIIAALIASSFPSEMDSA